MKITAIMRTTDPMNGNGRWPQGYPIKFRELLPMELKDKVSGKKGKQSDVACLPEMMTLFTCLAEKSYDSNNCSKEASAFQTCYDQYRMKKAEYRETGSLGILTPGLKASQLTSQQANSLLRKYPLTRILKKIRWLINSGRTAYIPETTCLYCIVNKTLKIVLHPFDRSRDFSVLCTERLPARPMPNN